MPGISAASADDETIEVDIDVKPDYDSSPINLNSNGVIPVAVWGSDTFDVLEIDGSTVSFGPYGATPVAQKFVDVDKDGYMDLQFKFKIGDTGISLETEEVTLVGELFNGTEIIGVDTTITPFTK